MARKKRHEEHENHERWLVSYADFITLLFAFFVVLYATSNRNEEKERQFQESIRNFMKSFAAVIVPGGSAPAAPGVVFESIDTVRRPFRNHQQMELKLQKIIESKLTEKDRQEYVPEVKSDAHGVRIVLSGTSFFPEGSAKMRLGATKALGSIADVLKTTSYRLIVEGHTDNQPVVGEKYESNWELGGARAASIVRFLSKVYGVDSAKMSAVSFADQKPVAENDTQANRARNQRVEILISTDPDE